MNVPAMPTYRVLLIHNFLSPYRIPLFAELATRFDLEVWILGNVQALRDWPSDAPDAGFQYRALSNWCLKLGSRYNAILLNYTLPWALIRHRHDVIVCCAWDTPAVFYAALHARVTGTPFVFWGGSTAYEPNPLRTVTRPLVRGLICAANAWIAYGTRAKEYLVSLGASANRTFCAYNTVDLDFFARASDAAQDGRDALKARLGIRTPHVVLYCGNLLDLKGVGDLLEGFSRFARDRDDVSLVLVGSGAGEAKYRAAAEQAGLGDRVVFAGFVARPEVPRFYALADLLVLASRHEVWGLVINEALASGVPVLCTDVVGASPDLIEHGVNGYVVPAQDPEALCAVLQRHFAADTDRDAMRDAARTRIRPFSIRRAADAFVDAVRCAVGEP